MEIKIRITEIPVGDEGSHYELETAIRIGNQVSNSLLEISAPEHHSRREREEHERRDRLEGN